MQSKSTNGFCVTTTRQKLLGVLALVMLMLSTSYLMLNYGDQIRDNTWISALQNFKAQRNSQPSDSKLTESTLTPQLINRTSLHAQSANDSTIRPMQVGHTIRIQTVVLNQTSKTMPTETSTSTTTASVTTTNLLSGTSVSTTSTTTSTLSTSTTIANMTTSPAAATAPILLRADSNAVLEQPEKMILSWNKFNENPFGAPTGRDPYPQDCGPGYHHCRVTLNRNYLETADAVFFFWPSLRRMRHDMPDPSKRQSFQKYVFLNSESAAYYPVNAVGDLDGFFNWTMAYRTDSDIVYPYGRVVERGNKSQSGAYVPQAKSKLVAQFVSNCYTPSKREEITRQLKALITVDVFGACGSMRCPSNDNAKCREMLEKDYFFYLAFENSLCKDYVTEKLFNQLQTNVVPIVLVRSIAAAVAPNSSFIAVDDFKSLEELAGYLKYLSTNLTAYGAYFTWKLTHFAESVVPLPFETALCPLCKALYNGSLMAQGSITNLYDWWNVKSACITKSYGKGKWPF